LLAGVDFSSVDHGDFHWSTHFVVTNLAKMFYYINAEMENEEELANPRRDSKNINSAGMKYINNRGLFGKTISIMFISNLSPP